jgi:REP element-mobilizing transposase RayT
MASTYLSLYYHLVFSTKNRAPIIDAAWRSRLHEYLGGTVRGLGGVSDGVGGVADHVHLLASFRASEPLADIVRELKKASSQWVHEVIGVRTFAWQEGYGAFTVGASARDAVRRYIRNQEHHHRVKSFGEELIGLLDSHGVAYDPRYVD